MKAMVEPMPEHWLKKSDEKREKEGPVVPPTPEQRAEWEAYPRGRVRLEDGTHIVFDGRRRPLARVLADGAVAVVAPDEELSFGEEAFFYEGERHPATSLQARKRVMRMVRQLGVADEVERRKALHAEPCAPAPHPEPDDDLTPLPASPQTGAAPSKRQSAALEIPVPSSVTGLTGTLRFDLELETYLTNERSTDIRRNLLSDALEIHHNGAVTPMTDDFANILRFSFNHASNGKEPAKDKIFDALSAIGWRGRYHPVIDYLDSLQWDGTPRLERWLIDHAGAEDTKLNRAIAKKSLCAAVRRVRHPGHKFDHVTVLQGDQDAGKSSVIKALVPIEGWFTDQLKAGTTAKETIEQASGAWIVEMAELDGLNRRESNAVKSFLTTTTDKARPAFGRYAVSKPRQFVLFGTTNDKHFLNDLTGNRRWWAVMVGACDPVGLSEVRDQLWAEAVAMEPNEKLWLDTDELKAEAAAVTEAVADRGPWFDLLADRIPAGPLKIAAADVWSLVGIEAGSINKISPGHRASLRRALAGLGFDPDAKNVRRGGKQIHAYVRGDPAEADWWSPDFSKADDGW